MASSYNHVTVHDKVNDRQFIKNTLHIFYGTKGVIKEKLKEDKKCENNFQNDMLENVQRYRNKITDDQLTVQYEIDQNHPANDTNTLLRSLTPNEKNIKTVMIRVIDCFVTVEEKQQNNYREFKIWLETLPGNLSVQSLITRRLNEIRKLFKSNPVEDEMRSVEKMFADLQPVLQQLELRSDGVIINPSGGDVPDFGYINERLAQIIADLKKVNPDTLRTFLNKDSANFMTTLKPMANTVSSILIEGGEKAEDPDKMDLIIENDYIKDVKRMYNNRRYGMMLKNSYDNRLL